MTSCRRFKATDLFTLNAVNLDILTETYNISFYLSYMSRWPDLFLGNFSQNGDMMGYIMGKAEGYKKEHHAHVTAVSVAPQYRRLGLARGMMDVLEEAGNSVFHGYFVDLFVRESNALAIKMYRSLGYSVYRRVVGYYTASKGPDEDAFDMRKPLAKDTKRECIREGGEDIRVDPDDVYF